MSQLSRAHVTDDRASQPRPERAISRDGGLYHHDRSGLARPHVITKRSAMPVTSGGFLRRASGIFAVALVVGCARQTPQTGAGPSSDSGASAARVTTIADEVVALAQAIGGVPRFSRSQLVPSALSRWDAAADRWLAELRPMKLDALAGRPEWVILGVMRDGLEATVGLRTCSERPEMRDACYAAIAVVDNASALARSWICANWRVATSVQSSTSAHSMRKYSTTVRSRCRCSPRRSSVG